MARRSLEDRFNRTLTQVGGQSIAITIPLEYLEELGWEKGDTVKVNIQRNRDRLWLTKVVEEETAE